MKFPKEKAIELIQRKIDEFKGVLKAIPSGNMYDQDYKKVYYGSEALLEELFSKAEAQSFSRNVSSGVSLSERSPAKELEDYNDHIQSCISQLHVYKERVQDFWESADADDPVLPINQPSLASLVTILGRFRECCQYVRNNLENERDIQDIVWIILRSHFDRVDREGTLPKFGIKNYRPDFGVPELNALIEIKFIGEKTQVAKIQEELLADIPGYLTAQSQYTGLIAFVYDAVHKLRDPKGFIEDIRKVDGILDVLVIPGI